MTDKLSAALEAIRKAAPRLLPGMIARALAGKSSESVPLTGKSQTEFAFQVMTTSMELAVQATIAELRERGWKPGEVLKSWDADGTPLTYRGVWTKAGQYPRGSAVTHDGGLWFAKAFTHDKPGNSSSWQLMAKSGPGLKRAG